MAGRSARAFLESSGPRCGGPVEQNGNWRLNRTGSAHQETQAIAAHDVVITPLSQFFDDARLKERLWNESWSGPDVGGHELEVRGQEEQLPTVPPPPRLRASLQRHLRLESTRRKRL